MAPDHTEALNCLALLLSDEPGGREEAVALYRRALVLEPDSAIGLFNLA